MHDPVPRSEEGFVLPLSAVRVLQTYGFRAVDGCIVLGRVYVNVAGPAPASTELLMRQLERAMTDDGLALSGYRSLVVCGALVLTLEATPRAVALNLREVA